MATPVGRTGKMEEIVERPEKTIDRDRPSHGRGWNGPRSKDLFAAALCEIIPSIDYAVAADAA